MIQPWRTILVLAATLSLGGLGLLAFSLFLYNGPPEWIRFDMNRWEALGWDGALCLVFFIQHSGMLRRSVRQFMGRYVPAAYLGAAYGAVSGALLLGLVLLWQPTAPAIGELTGWALGVARGCFFLSVAGFVWTAKSLDHFDPLGAASLMTLPGKTVPPKMTLATSGPYRWVRHPFYFLSIVMIWSYPEWTHDRLLFNLTWTIWIWFGTVLEERDLVRTYGKPYQDYQKSVPMLLPLTIPDSGDHKKL